MRHERMKYQPQLPRSIEEMFLTQEMRMVNDQEFVFIENSIMMFGKSPLLQKLKV